MFKNSLKTLTSLPQPTCGEITPLMTYNSHQALREEILERASRGETQMSLPYEESKLSHFIKKDGSLGFVPNLRDLFELLRTDGVSSVRLGNQLILNWE